MHLQAVYCHGCLVVFQRSIVLCARTGHQCCTARETRGDWSGRTVYINLGSIGNPEANEIQGRSPYPFEVGLEWVDPALVSNQFVVQFPWATNTIWEEVTVQNAHGPLRSQSWRFSAREGTEQIPSTSGVYMWLWWTVGRNIASLIPQNIHHLSFDQAHPFIKIILVWNTSNRSLVVPCHIIVQASQHGIHLQVISLLNRHIACFSRGQHGIWFADSPILPSLLTTVIIAWVWSTSSLTNQELYEERSSK